MTKVQSYDCHSGGIASSLAAPLAAIAGIHLGRFLLINVLTVVQWSVVMPGEPLYVWCTLLAAQNLIGRLPSVARKDLIFVAAGGGNAAGEQRAGEIGQCARVFQLDVLCPAAGARSSTGRGRSFAGRRCLLRERGLTARGQPPARGGTLPAINRPLAPAGTRLSAPFNFCAIQRANPLSAGRSERLKSDLRGIRWLGYHPPRFARPLPNFPAARESAMQRHGSPRG